VLRRESNGDTIRLCPRCREVIEGNQPCGCELAGSRRPLREKGTSRCPECTSKYVDVLTAPFYARYEPLVVVSQCSIHGLRYRSLSTADLSLLTAANARRSGLDFGSDLEIVPGPKSSDLIRRRVRSYLDLFSSRQLLYLQNAIEILGKFDGHLRLYLALLVSTSLEFNSMLCGYKGSSVRRPGAIRHTFSHHAYSFPYTALENNPLNHRRASGTLPKLFHDRVRRAREWAESPVERRIVGEKISVVKVVGEVDTGMEVSDISELSSGERRFHLIQGSSTTLQLGDGSVDFVVTDPPYFDSVQYSDLSAFFRVWLSLLLPDEEELGVDWDYDASYSAVAAPAEDAETRPEETYRTLMTAIARECARVLRKERGRFVFSFHHWSPKGWAAITIALKRANFRLVNRFVVHSENPVSVHVANLRALTDDAILVLAPGGGSIAREWIHPGVIDTSDSALFCEECATLLGWMLERALPDREIERFWEESLRR
jgi:putative DNA methylase